MDSFYITTSIDERVKRLQERTKLGNEITGSDKLIMDEDKFKRTEQIYKNLVLEYFPNTKIVDTTEISIEETINLIIEDENFIQDM